MIYCTNPTYRDWQNGPIGHGNTVHYEPPGPQQAAAAPVKQEERTDEVEEAALRRRDTPPILFDGRQFYRNPDVTEDELLSQYRMMGMSEEEIAELRNLPYWPMKTDDYRAMTVEMAAATKRWLQSDSVATAKSRKNSRGRRKTKKDKFRKNQRDVNNLHDELLEDADGAGRGKNGKTKKGNEAQSSTEDAIIVGQITVYRPWRAS